MYCRKISRRINQKPETWSSGKNVFPTMLVQNTNTYKDTFFIEDKWGLFSFFFLLNLLNLIVFMFRAAQSEPARGEQFARGTWQSFLYDVVFSVMSAWVRSGIKRCFESGSFSSHVDALSSVSRSLEMFLSSFCGGGDQSFQIVLPLLRRAVSYFC